MKNLSVGSFLGYIGMGILIVGVAVFLGGHSLNFFQISFKDGQQAYAPLGLLLTEGGFFIWLVIFLTIAVSNMQKAIALVMLVVSLIGGMATAVFDIYFETATGAAGFQLSLDEIKAMSLVVGALAVFHGVALVFELAGNKIFDAFETTTGKDLNRDGRIGDSGKQNERSNNPAYTVPEKRKPQPHNNGGNPQVRTYNLDGLLSALSMDRAEFKSFLMDTETFTKAWQVLRDDGRLPKDITHRNFNDLCGQVNPTVPSPR